MAKSCEWWRTQKRRTQKKYFLFLGMYLTPREVRTYFVRKEKLRNDKWQSI